MAYLPQQGTKPDGTPATLPISGRKALTKTPLAANATWNSGWLNIDDYVGISTILYSDVPGSYILEYSEDGGTTTSLPTITVQYTLTGQTRKGSFDPSASWVRFTYTNGSTAQNMFVFSVRFNNSQSQASTETLNATGADTRMAVWNKSRIETKTSDATNDYAPIYRTGNSLNANVTNFPATQVVNQGTNPWVTRGDKSPTATSSTVSVLATTTTVLLANTNRKGATIWAEGIIYLLLGSGASQTNYSIKMSTGTYYEVPFNYTGIITAVGATVAVRVTELT